METIIAVIRREYVQRVRNKWFVITTLAAPLFLFGIIFIPSYLAQRSAEKQRTVAILDRTGLLHSEAATRLEEAGFTIQAPVPATSELELSHQVAMGELGGYLILDQETLQRGRAVYRGQSGLSTLRRLAVQGAVVRAVLGARLGAAGGTGELEALFAGGELDVQVLGAEERLDEDEPAYATAFAGALLMYMVILFYAVAVLRSVLEEKTGRIVEIILSSMRPWQLMLGKILGVGAVGLTQLAFWFLMAVVIVILALPNVVAFLPQGMELSDLKAFLPDLGLVILFGVYFVLGYFVYSALYAAVGAMCSTEEEAQQAQFPVIMLLVVPIILLAPVIENPKSTLAVITSLVPFFTPILMFPRAAAGAAPAWQLVLSVVVMLLALVGVAWVAGRIYKVGIVMQGKRPTLPELWRWVREA